MRSRAIRIRIKIKGKCVGMMTFCPQIFRFLVLANEVSVTRFHFYTLRPLHGYASTRIMSGANDTHHPLSFFLYAIHLA